MCKAICCEVITKIDSGLAVDSELIFSEKKSCVLSLDYVTRMLVKSCRRHLGFTQNSNWVIKGVIKPCIHLTCKCMFWHWNMINDLIKCAHDLNGIFVNIVFLMISSKGTRQTSKFTTYNCNIILFHACLSHVINFVWC